MDFINDGLLAATGRGNEWRTILHKEYEFTMMATMKYVCEGCRHTCVTWVADSVPPKAPVIEDAFLTSLFAANRKGCFVDCTATDATCKVPLFIASLSPMLHKIAWCEARVARADVSIAAKVTHVTFHAESIDRLVRQAVSVGVDGIGHRVVQVCGTAFKRCFDQIAQYSIDALEVGIKTLEKARQDLSLRRRPCGEEGAREGEAVETQ